MRGGALLRGDRLSVAEKLAFLDYLHDLRRNQLFPAAIRGMQLCQNVGRVNPQILGMIIRDLLDVAVIDQVMEEGTQIRRDFDLFRRNNLAAPVLNHWIDVELQAGFKHSAERL